MSRTTIALPAAFAALALFAAAPASASSRDDTGARFIIRAPGRTIGRECYRPVSGPGPGERTIEARAWAEFPKAGLYRLDQRLTFDVLGRVRAYAVEIDSPTGLMKAGASVRAGIGTLTFSLGDSARSRAVDCPPGAALIDPFFANHYQWFLDRLLATGMSTPLPDSVFVLNPQSLEMRQEALAEIQGEVGFFEGRAVSVRRLELSIPKQRAQIWFDGETGRLYRVRLLTQFMDIVREGFRPTADDTLLPARGLAPVELSKIAGGALCGGVHPIGAPEETRAVAILLPDGGPPEAPADSSLQFVEDLAQTLAGDGIAAYAVDPREGGCNGPSALVRGWVNPALGLIDALIAAGVPAERVFVIGHGLGAIAAARIAVRDSLRLGGIVLLAPPIRPANAWLHERVARCLGDSTASAGLGWMPVDWTDIDTFDLKAALIQSARPVLVLSAEEDCETDGLRARATFARVLSTSMMPDSESRLVSGVDHLFRDSTKHSAAAALAHDLSFWIESSLPLAR